MAKYAIYITNQGTATARPVRRMLELSDLPQDDWFAKGIWDDSIPTASAAWSEPIQTRLQLQTATLAADEAAIKISDTAEFYDIDNDATTNDWTVDTTVALPFLPTLTPVSIDRLTLEQRQALVRDRRDTLLAGALQLQALDQRLTEADFQTLETYLAALRAIPDAPANPSAVVFPTLGAIGNNDGSTIRVKSYRRGNVGGAVGLTIDDIPTGALAEKGYNSNGIYWKFTNGVLLMSHRLVVPYFSPSSLSVTWTLPHVLSTERIGSTFVGAVLSVKDNNNNIPANQLSAGRMQNLMVYVNSLGTTSYNFIIRDTQASLTSSDITWMSVIAMGWWASI